MKSFVVALLSLFTFLVAPQIPTLRTASAASVVVTTAAPPNWADLFQEMKPKEKASVSCESTVSDKCVPMYRLSDEISADSAGRAIEFLDAANAAGATEILIELNTPGGSVPDGFELARAIENSKAPVTCVVDGDAASMGAYILQSCDSRAMTKRSKVMFHEPSLGGQFKGQPNQWQAIANMLKAEAEALAEHCSRRMNVSLKYYHSKTDGGQMWFLNHGEAKKIGAVDEIVRSVRSLHSDMLLSKSVHPKQL